MYRVLIAKNIDFVLFSIQWSLFDVWLPLSTDKYIDKTWGLAFLLDGFLCYVYNDFH